MLGSYLGIECQILTAHYAFIHIFKALYQKNLKTVSSHPELRYIITDGRLAMSSKSEYCYGALF